MHFKPHIYRNYVHKQLKCRNKVGSNRGEANFTSFFDRNICFSRFSAFRPFFLLKVPHVSRPKINSRSILTAQFNLFSFEMFVVTSVDCLLLSFSDPSDVYLQCKSGSLAIKKKFRVGKEEKKIQYIDRTIISSVFYLLFRDSRKVKSDSFLWIFRC